MTSEPTEPANQDQPSEGTGEESPRSNTSLDSESDPRVNDLLAAPDLENAPGPISLVASRQSVAGAQNEAIARVVAENLRDVNLGKYLPDTMAREKRERIIKAEALWLAGVASPDDIAKVSECSKATIYAWASAYHWPKRADIAQLGQEALRTANMVAIAAKARAALSSTAGTNTASSGVDPAVSVQPPPVRPPPTGADIPEDVVDLLAARDARPMGEADAARAAVIQSAAADAHQNTIIALFVEAISKITDEQREVTNRLVEMGTMMTTDLFEAYKAEKAKRSKTMTSKEVRAEVSATLPMYRQLVATLSQAIQLQRRVWMIADAGKASADDDDLPRWDGGLESGGKGVPVPVPRDTYENTIIQAERQGIDLTKGPGAKL